MASNWTLEFEGFDPQRQPLREALCTLGNGYFATRGAGEEATADGVNYPGTYLAGGFNRAQSHIAGRMIENEDLVNFPNWLALSFRAEGAGWLNLSDVKILLYRVTLDLRHGLLTRLLRVADQQGRRTRLESCRIVHMKSCHLAAITQTITAENWSGAVDVRSALDARVVNGGVARYRQLTNEHVETIAQAGGYPSPSTLTVRTRQSGLVVGLSARTRLYADRTERDCEREFTEEPGLVAEDLRLTLEQEQPVTVEKVVALYSSRDAAVSEPGDAARLAVEQAPGFDALEISHRKAWEGIWRRADIAIEDTCVERPTQLLRFHTFHLMQTLSPHTADLDVGVPARGLHGEAYRGHVFWDELFVLPFYNARFPHIARALLKYRYRRLDVARQRARKAGFAGAMFPWQSGSSGREENQRLHLNPKSGRWLEDHTHLQRHVTAAIAYNVWSHYQVTRDLRFLLEFGAEMLFEIARFWASITEWNEARERFEIRNVMGPDEYHDGYVGRSSPGIDNNAYTNIMAVWCLTTALKCLDTLAPGHRREIMTALDLSEAEIQSWQRISTRMFVPFHDGHIISQFEGYEQLQEFDWQHYRTTYRDIQRLDRLLEAEGDTPNRYKLSKQADVLMLFYLFSAEELTALLARLGYAFDSRRIPEIIEYYLQRTSHGSSLSRVVHSWVLARSDRQRSWELFLEALESDMDDAQNGTTAEGIHLGAMAATIDLIERCYSGREVESGQIRFNPRLPDELEGLCFNFAHWGNWLNTRVTHHRVRISAGTYITTPVALCVNDNTYHVNPGEAVVVPLRR